MFVKNNRRKLELCRYRMIEMATEIDNSYTGFCGHIEVEARNVLSGRSKAKPHQHAHSTSPRYLCLKKNVRQQLPKYQ